MKSSKQLNKSYSLKIISYSLILLLHPIVCGQGVISAREKMFVKSNPETTAQFSPVSITTEKLTITGGGIPQPTPPPFQPIAIETGKLTISGGGIQLPPAPPFQRVTITTSTLTISGKSNK